MKEEETEKGTWREERAGNREMGGRGKYELEQSQKKGIEWRFEWEEKKYEERGKK